jgi:putative transposase
LTCPPSLKPVKTEIIKRLIQIYVSLNSELKKRKGKREQPLYAIDSTVITLTGKLFWMSGYHQMKLVMGVDAETGSIGERHLHFGSSNDESFAELIPNRLL